MVQEFGRLSGASKGKGMPRLLLLLVIAGSVATGCMTFNGAELPRRDLPEDEPFRPLVSTEVGEIKLLFNGKDGLKPAMTATGIGSTVLDAVLLRWKGSRLIDDYGKPGELERDADYILKISGTQNEEGSFLASFVTGFTLFLFPSSATLNRSWQFDLTEIATQRVYSVSAKHSVTQWMHLIFLPVFPFSIVGQMNADRDLSHYLYDEFSRQGAWGDGGDDRGGL
jgi:hypothetical protein